MATPSTSVPADQRSWNVLRTSDFKRYFIGSLCSNAGTWIQNTAQILLAYRLTNSVVAVGFVSVAQWGGVLILGPWAGALADRMDPRQLLIVSQIGAGVAAFLLMLASSQEALTMPYLIAGALFLGLTYTFALPVFSTLIPALVPGDQIKSALMMNTVSYNVGRAVAPLIGIGIVTAIGFTAAFLINSLSFFILAGVLYSLKIRNKPKSARKPEFRGSYLAGFSIAWHNKRILLVLLMVAAATVATDPPNVLGPALAQHEFEVSDAWAGAFIAAMGAGNILGALLPIRVATLRNAAQSLFVVGLGMAIFAGSPWIWGNLLGATVSGIGSLLLGATAQSLIVKYAEPDQLGRVMAVWAIAFAGSRPIASLVDSAFATVFTLQTAALLMTVPALASIALLLPASITRGREFFRGGRLLRPKPQVANG